MPVKYVPEATTVQTIEVTLAFSLALGYVVIKFYMTPEGGHEVLLFRKLKKNKKK